MDSDALENKRRAREIADEALAADVAWNKARAPLTGEAIGPLDRAQRPPDDLDACRTSGDVYMGAFDDAAVLRVFAERGYQARFEWDAPQPQDVEEFGEGGKALRINGEETGWGYSADTGPDGKYAWCVTHENTQSFVRDENAARALVVMGYAHTNGRERLDRRFEPFERVPEAQERTL